jgi:outer membrane protein OmpA-like peptidoglycan-associated protein
MRLECFEDAMNTKIPYFTMLLCGLVACGCAAVIVGAGAGAGAAAYIKGRVTRTYDAEYHQTVRASIETLGALKIAVMEKAADELKTTIHAKRADGTPVSLEVVRTGSGQTEVGVRTGAVGVTERDASEQIQEWISERIGKKSLEESKTAGKSGQTLQPEPVEKPPHASVGPDTAPKKESSTSILGTAKRSPPERTIYFDQDSNELLKNEVLKLDRIAEALIRQPDLKVSLNGYSDASGSTEYNRMISESRASSVKMYLVGKGVDPLRISVVGHGMKDFAASNASEEGQRLNRRVEITIGGK